MGKVGSSATMSLDGYIAFDDDTVGALFDWYDSGDVEITTARPDLTFHVTQQSADYWHQAIRGSGALVVGRALFDVTDGWGGRHPIDLPVVVVTHSVPTEWVERFPDAPFTFVTEGVDEAVGQASEHAGDDGVVGLAGASVVHQALNAGLLDAVRVSLAPYVLGDGIPYFGKLDGGPVKLGQPKVVEAKGVTHIHYEVVR